MEHRLRQRILPNQIFFRYFRADVPRFWPHIAVGQLEPRARKGFVEGLRIVQEATGNFLEFRIKTQRQVGDQHGWLAFFRRVERVRHNFRRIHGFELNGARRATRLHPFVFEQVLEEVIAPLGRGLRPDNFQPGGDGVSANTGAVRAGPAQALRFNRRRFRVSAHVRGFTCAVRFTERMSARNQRDGLFVIHAHVAKGSADRRRRRQRFTAGVWPFRVHINQAHFGGRKRALRQRFRVTVGQPGFFIAPVHVQIRFPDVFTPGTETKGAEAGVLQRHVTREDKEVSPGDFLSVFLLNWPQQAASLIQADVIRPGVQRCKALLTASGAAATVNGAIGTRTVPGHTDKQARIAAPVGRPPRL